MSTTATIIKGANSPYCGAFQITQCFELGRHDGLDLVGIDSKDIHSTVSGEVIYANWENPNNHYQGFGQYVCIRTANGKCHYFGHLSKILAKVGQQVKCTDVIGVEGSTGYSTGSHCHYEIRDAFYKGAKVNDVCAFTGIPNKLYGVFDDGYRPNKSNTPEIKVYSENCAEDVKALQTALKSHGYECGETDGIVGDKTISAMFKALCEMWLK